MKIDIDFNMRELTLIDNALFCYKKNGNCIMGFEEDLEKLLEKYQEWVDKNKQ